MTGWLSYQSHFFLINLGVSPLGAAISGGCQLDFIKELLKHNADPSGCFCGSLKPYTFEALKRERADILEALLQRGADPLKTYAGQTLLQAALMRRLEAWCPKDSTANKAVKVILQNGTFCNGFERMFHIQIRCLKLCVIESVFALGVSFRVIQ